MGELIKKWMKEGNDFLAKNYIYIYFIQYIHVKINIFNINSQNKI